MRRKIIAVLLSVLILLAVCATAVQLSRHAAAQAEESLAGSFYVYELREASYHFLAISPDREALAADRDYLLGMASFKSAIDMLQFRPAESRNHTYFSDVYRAMLQAGITKDNAPLYLELGQHLAALAEAPEDPAIANQILNLRNAFDPGVS